MLLYCYAGFIDIYKTGGNRIGEIERETVEKGRKRELQGDDEKMKICCVTVWQIGV